MAGAGPAAACEVKEVRARRRAGDVRALVPIINRLQDLGLTLNEARALVALLQVGPAAVSEVARVSGIHRTSVYPVLEALRSAGLAATFSSPSTRWACIGVEKTIDRLYADAEDRLRRLVAEKEELSRLLAEVVRDAAEETLPGVRLVQGPDATNEVYLQMLREARAEVLVFNRAPYGLVAKDPINEVLGLLERGVSIRALYRRVDLDPAFAQETEVYLAAGLQARLVDQLPTKLVVVDRSSALVAMMAPDDVAGFPISQHVEHSGFAATWGDVFDRFWSTAQPLDPGGRS